MSQHDEIILILDFGSQYTQLIARKIRELGVYCEIHPFTISEEKIKVLAPQGIVLSGGPKGVTEKNAPLPFRGLLELGIPVLGICYGLQVITHFLGGKVVASKAREYGPADLSLEQDDCLLKDIPSPTKVWMSHGDKISEIPDHFQVLARTGSAPFAAIAEPERKIYGIQFHPEVYHTTAGKTVLHNFIYNACACVGNWTMANFVEETVASIRALVGDDEEVVCGLSGGVDSVVAAALVYKAIGKRLHCIFVDNGLLRKDEAREVAARFDTFFGDGFQAIDAGEKFLTKLKGVVDPEKKRRIIGNEFISVFERESKKIGEIAYLVQGTLYPDVIESISPDGGPSVTIKTHHNVGGLPEKMHLKLIEPLRELFKDEVRRAGKELGIPDEMLGRHPFPGPGLAVRILGDITDERVRILQEADAIFIAELRKAGWYDKIWQAFAVLLPVNTVGVMGDQRTYECAAVLRAVTSVDGMTADWGRLPYDLLARASNRIINEVKGINRVVYDISSKPPATIEWE